MISLPSPKISLKKLTQKELHDFCRWKEYFLVFNRVTKDDSSCGLDSNVFLELSLAIRPGQDKNLTTFSDLIDLLLNTRKETTISYSELPERFFGHFFDEVTICPMGKLATEIPAEYGEIFMANWRRNFVATYEMNIDLNLTSDPREGPEICLPNAFDMEDWRLRHILDCFQVFNEFCPSHPLSTYNVIFFYKRLNELKNIMFDLKNPDEKGEFNLFKDRHRYWIPPSDIALKKSAKQNVKKILAVYNQNWKLLNDLEALYEQHGYGFRYHSSPALDFMRDILKYYGHFLRHFEVGSFCLNCDYYFEFKKGKKFCSLADGRNCGKSYRNKRDYLKHREDRQKQAADYMRGYRKLLSDKGVRK